MVIKKSQKEDIEYILEIYNQARNFMIKQNNPTQWAKGYPQKEIIENDIKTSSSYVCVDNIPIKNSLQKMWNNLYCNGESRVAFQKTK